ncbi:hypothetical protein B296_00054747 [Ensete ventricosum]|uniref:Uncharacterized protein n=1 Tax=Ensete ventricosum TaxID=4639 RepID=A0A426XNC1_ENSVE|nr:hypothetical protein B296_00054747 [Ensete ventricosum]
MHNFSDKREAADSDTSSCSARFVTKNQKGVKIDSKIHASKRKDALELTGENRTAFLIIEATEMGIRDWGFTFGAENPRTSSKVRDSGEVDKNDDGMAPLTQEELTNELGGKVWWERL